MKIFVTLCGIAILAANCASSKKIKKALSNIILNDSAMRYTNIGISIFNTNTNSYLYNHNSKKYFIPASNTKLLTCYAALKYLPDSLPALQYRNTVTEIEIKGTGDPTFLVPEYKYQPVAAMLRQQNRDIKLYLHNWRDSEFGFGWSWTDFGSDYAQSRSALPMYYNSVTFSYSAPKSDSLIIMPEAFVSHIYTNNGENITNAKKVSIVRDAFTNQFRISPSNTRFQSTKIPYLISNNIYETLLSKAFNTNATVADATMLDSANNWRTMYSQPTDSLLQPMMQRSDNFYAEQALLMVSNHVLGYMNSADIIAHIKNSDFKNMPQAPRWVDGSGLSRYNMVTPESIVWLLQKMQNEFGLNRLKKILPSGGQGTLSSLYKNINGAIHAKTGTLSNHAALSGYLLTKKGNAYIFSTLTSGYQGSPAPVRKAVEKLLLYIYEKY
jgi:D-alanyl-D-alanine carboxypeptidase/D-alanyl-D-alanine-endopeptidase (penicillin-binding protein 4)